jgi:SAM-dependent methyltransferase
MIVPIQARLPVATDAPAVVWEEADCPLCESRQHKPVLEAPDVAPGTGGLWFAVVQCQLCGLCYTNPRPDAATIGQFYPVGYGPHTRARPRRKLRKWYPLAAIEGRPRPELRNQPTGARRRLLDFGCGGGTFLERMAGQGWEVTGLDLSAEAVRCVREELGLPVLHGTLPHPDVPPDSFDVVTMWHSLEHVHAPLETLRQVRAVLRPGGRLFVAVPNIESWPFRQFGRWWYGLDVPRHLTHFAPATLRLMLERGGFRLDSLRMIRHSDWLRSSALLAASRPDCPGWQRLLTRKLPARLVAWGCYAAGQSDCILAIAHRPTE